MYNRLKPLQGWRSGGETYRNHYQTHLVPTHLTRKDFSRGCHSEKGLRQRHQEMRRGHPKPGQTYTPSIISNTGLRPERRLLAAQHLQPV